MHDNNARRRTFEEGESVFVRNFRPGRPWIPGHVVRLSGPVSLVVKLTNGYVVKRHQDHVRKRSESMESSDHETLPEPVDDTAVPVPAVVGTEEDSVPAAPTEDLTSAAAVPTSDSATSSPPTAPQPMTSVPNANSTVVPTSASPRHRYPTRSRVPPDRYCY